MPLVSDERKFIINLALIIFHCPIRAFFGGGGGNRTRVRKHYE